VILPLRNARWIIRVVALDTVRERRLVPPPVTSERRIAPGASCIRKLDMLEPPQPKPATEANRSAIPISFFIAPESHRNYPAVKSDEMLLLQRRRADLVVQEAYAASADRDPEKAPEDRLRRFAAKAVVGDKVEVAADIWKDGTSCSELRSCGQVGGDELSLGSMRRRRISETACWRESVLPDRSGFSNDRWYATISPHEVGPHAFTVVAWTDRFGPLSPS